MPQRSTIDPREKQLDVPKRHKVAIFREHQGPVTIEEADVVHNLPRGQALVRVIYSGVCHTDLHALANDWPLNSKLPLVGGHEGAGVVVKLGEGADQHVKIGDRVGIKWINSSCGDCVYCRKSHEPNCVKAECSGFTVDGSFQQYAVADAKSLTPIPAALSLETAAPLLCAGVTVYKACRQAGFTPGDTVVIVGSGGGLGHLATQYASYMGARVIGIDTGADKRALSAKCGAEVFIDFAHSKDLVQDIKNATPDGLGPQAAIVAASGAKAYEQALEYLRPRGVLVPVGLPPAAVIKADVFWTVFKSLSIVASYVGNRQEAIEALDIAARGKINVVSRTLGLTDLPAVYKDMHAGRIAGRIVLDIDR